MKKSIKNNKIYYIISALVMILIVIGFSYAYFASDIDTEANIIYSIKTDKNDGAYTFEATGETVTNITLTDVQMYEKDQDVIVHESEVNMTLSLTNEDSVIRTCTYDIVWVWDTNYDSYTMSNGASKEYTVTGTNFEEAQVPNYDANSFVLVSGRIVAGAQTNTQELVFNTKFYNLENINQEAHAGKNYVGSIKVDNLVCSHNDADVYLATTYGGLPTYENIIAPIDSVECINLSGEWNYKYNGLVVDLSSKENGEEMGSCTVNKSDEELTLLSTHVMNQRLGTCSDTNYKTVSSCQNAGGTWTDSDGSTFVAYCSNNAYSNQSECEAAGEDWIDFAVVHEGIYGTGHPISSRLKSSDFQTVTQGSPYGFDENSDGTWVSTNQNVNSSKSTVTLIPKTSSSYTLCYTVYSEKKYDYGIVKVDGTQVLTTKGSSNTEFICINLGNLTSSNEIYIEYYKDSSQSTMPDEFVFYIATGEPENTLLVDYGYRYEGDNPNNYVWFNEELWRIIGVFETEYATESKPCNTDSDSDGHFDNCETGNLVKIIRNDSMGGLAWDYDGSSYINDWSQASLKILMNEYWFNKEDATDSNYCYGYNYNGMKASCDYRGDGLKEEYRDMVVKAKWHLGGASGPGYTASQFYEYERGTTTYSGRPKEYVDYVGLMYVSDYGYAPLVSDCSRGTTLGDYYNSSYRVGCTGNNWLYGKGDQWYITLRSSYSDHVFYLNNLGQVTTAYSYNGCGVRQSLYLEPNVYVLEGEGSAESPYVVM